MSITRQIIRKKFYVYKLKNVTNAMLDELKEADIFNALFSVEPMPKYVISLDFLEEDDDIPIKNRILKKII